MKRVLLVFLVLFISIHAALASTMPCVVTEQSILVNLTNNQGCAADAFYAYQGQF